MQQQTRGRIWKTRGSLYKWLWLLNALVLVGWVYVFYRTAIATELYPGPLNDPLREFGIIAFVLVLLVAAYSLRRRFVRDLPGKVEDWLWLHVWFGLSSVLIACMHENFQNITHDFSFNQSRFTEAAFGTSALYALLLLVLTGVFGRLLDMWQARVISREAASNGVGITRSVEERLFELVLVMERLAAGKSAAFKHYCRQALHRRGNVLWWSHRTSRQLPLLAPSEVEDFRRASTVLAEYRRLEGSLRRQRRARLIMRAWRFIHISLACAALAVICYHSIFELWKWLVLRQ